MQQGCCATLQVMDAVEDIKSRLSIEDVVSQYVELKRAGRNFKGLSPFSSERTPSFMVSPEKQIWHDFSSGKGGNMFSFVMEMEGLDFKGALELLARKAGVDLEQYRGHRTSNTQEKERLHEALDWATKFYQRQLVHTTNAIEYVFKKRKFTKDTVREWQLGYSPNTGTALCDFLRMKGFSEKEIKGAGLSAQRYRGLGDMFRGRLMIPLHDAQGRVIGFTARILEDDPNAPKYINTPQTLLYDKSRHVFGLHLAKESIRKDKFAVIAEGNLDVISSHQAGVRQVVATAGTALTEYQLKALSRFTPDIRLCFDADKAGLSATERAIPIASKVGVSLSIVTIPSGKDPDELVRQDPGKWLEIIDKPAYAVDWLIERYQKELDLNSAQGKRNFSDILMAVIEKLTDQVEREHYINRIAMLLNVSKEALLSKEKDKDPPKKLLKRINPAPIDREESDYIKAQNKLMSLVYFSDMRDLLDPMTVDMIVQDEARTFFIELKQSHNKNTPIEFLPPLEDYVNILSLVYERLYKGTDSSDLRIDGERYRSKLIDRYIKIQTPRLDHAIEQVLRESGSDSPEYKKLHKKVINLNELRKNYAKGA